MLLLYRIVPIEEETELAQQNRRSGNSYRGVAPVSPFPDLSEVLVADVEPADEADFTINDSNFAVIPEIGPKIQEA